MDRLHDTDPTYPGRDDATKTVRAVTPIVVTRTLRVSAPNMGVITLKVAEVGYAG